MFKDRSQIVKIQLQKKVQKTSLNLHRALYNDFLELEKLYL
jgi:hypothetical protein